jgi:hypothetical protein
VRLAFFFQHSWVRLTFPPTAETTSPESISVVLDADPPLTTDVPSSAGDTPAPALPPTEVTPLIQQEQLDTTELTPAQRRHSSPSLRTLLQSHSQGHAHYLRPHLHLHPHLRPHSHSSFHAHTHAHAAPNALEIYGNHHRHEPRAVHLEHHEPLPRTSVVLLDEDSTDEDVLLAKHVGKHKHDHGCAHGHGHNHGARHTHGHAHGHAHADLEALTADASEHGGASGLVEDVAVGRGRQVVGILVCDV